MPQFPFWTQDAPLRSVALSMLACFLLVFIIAWLVRLLYSLLGKNWPTLQFFPFALLLASTLWGHVFLIATGAIPRLVDVLNYISAHSDGTASTLVSCLYEIFFSFVILPVFISPLSIIVGLPMCLIHVRGRRWAPITVYTAVGLIMATSYAFWAAMEWQAQEYNS